MTQRVLIVTSSYAPAMIADMHRARQLAWDLPGAGWQVEILCPDERMQPPSCLDADSRGFFAPGVKAHYVPEYASRLFRALRIQGIGWRALFPMLVAGWRLLRRREFDLVYLSTAQFPLFLLGPVWLKLTRVPFVLDIHDPVYKAGSVTPHWARSVVRHRIGQWVARFTEWRSLSAAAGLIAVSAEYLHVLRQRYEPIQPPWLRAGRHAVVPFAVLPHDFEEAAGKALSAGDARDSRVRIVYAGAGGPVMRRSFLLLCKVLAHLREREPHLLAGVCVELYGTMLHWREGEASYLADLARAAGLADVVSEHPGRITYRRSVELLLEGDGVLVFGVDDSGYMPSKLFSYAMSGKPLLAVLRRDGSAYAHFQGTRALGHAIWFERVAEMEVEEAALVAGEFLRQAAGRATIDRQAILHSRLSAVMARRHAKVFEACLGVPPDRRRVGEPA